MMDGRLSAVECGTRKWRHPVSESDNFERTRSVYGNTMPAKTVRKAKRQYLQYLRRFGDDRSRRHVLEATDIPALESIGVRSLMVRPAGASKPSFSVEQDPRAVVIGTIRMGFGHYRIAIAMASAARSLGWNPYLFDLHSFQELLAGKIVSHLNGLYSLGSRLSQRSRLFNALYWEPLNSEGFRRLSYNAVDQAVSSLMATPCRLLPPGVPFLATHAWPAQAAVHAGLERVINAIPDNWPMALHLAEGAIHTVQSPSAWFGYKSLNGMAGSTPCRPMSDGSLVMTGHYVDHELVSNLAADSAARLDRLASGRPVRVLLSVGGAGAQQDLYARIIRHLMPAVIAGRVCLWINAGDHREVAEKLRSFVPELSSAVEHGADWKETTDYACAALGADCTGVHLWYSPDIFQAVYTTNLLMRATDLLVTKPSELAFYPVPKLMVRRVGGHEAWGAVRAAEIGDGTIECSDTAHSLAMLDLLLESREALTLMNSQIMRAGSSGIYSGAFRAVELAVGKL